MKKANIVISLLILLFLSGCGLPVRMTEVRGSGQIKTETRHISGIRSVDLSGIGRLVIVQGNKESLEITTDENLLSYIQSEVSGNHLNLGLQDFVNIDPTDGLTYTLTVKDLSSVETSGLGSVEIDSLVTDDLRIEVSGTGDINIADLSAKNLTLSVSGVGSVDLAGSVDDQSVEISGSGNYQAGDLFSQSARIEISGTGSAQVWATDQLAVELSGMGNLSYYGSPVMSIDISGMGRVESLGRK